VVKLDKIYTRGGDRGETSLGTGARVAKHDPRVEAYGDLDELNAHIGNCARLYARRQDRLTQIMSDLFDLGAELCLPGDERFLMPEDCAQRLEAWIDETNAKLPALSSFILPGGNEAGTALHLARTVCRRAERRVTELAAMEGEVVSDGALRYVNRLSDLLFVWAREANGDADEILWRPRATEEG
jgi:cob(I)alamin adenosyltransferase